LADGDERVRFEVTRADAYVTWDFDIAALRRTVWEYITVPGQWQKWWPTDAILENSSNGRRGVGTKNHCMHGKDAIIEEVLDWRPFEYFTVSTLLPIPGAPKVVMTRALQDRPNGATHLEMRAAKPKPKDKELVDRIGSKFAEDLTKAIGNLRLMLEGQQTSVALIDEPPLMPFARLMTQEPNHLSAKTAIRSALAKIEHSKIARTAFVCAAHRT
jgi:hypothetical protein